MYTIVQVKRKTDVRNHQYMFKDFKAFYELADLITYPIFGRYKVGIKSDNVKDIKEFISLAKNYEALDIYVYVPSATVEYLSVITTDVKAVQERSPFTLLTELINEKHLYIEKKVMYKLYNSIGHDIDDMEEAVNEIYEEYGPEVEITTNMLEKLFVIESTTYPRQVMIAYLKMDRDRERILQKCIDDVGPEVTMWAVRKNVSELVDGKAKYFKSGMTSNYIKSIDTRNLMIMYKVFCVERVNLKDVEILLALYERGISCNDIIQERDVDYDTERGNASGL